MDSVHFKLPLGEIKEISKVLNIPNLKKNLLSIGSFTDHPIIECFDNQKCILYNKDHKKIVAKGFWNKENGLYQLSSHPPNLTANITSIDLYTARLWHHRLGHLSFARFHELASNNMVIGLPYIPAHSETCEACIRGKQTRASLPKVSTSRAPKALDL